MNSPKSFFSLLVPHRSWLIAAFFAMFGAHALGLVFPWALKLFIDTVLPGKNAALAGQLLLALFVSSLLKFCCGFLREYIVIAAGERIVCDLRNKLYWQVQRLSVPYTQDTSKGEIISRIITDVEAVKDFLFGGIVDFLYAFFNIALVLALLFALDRRLAVVSIVWLPVTALLFIRYTPPVSRSQQDIRVLYGKMTGRLQEVLDGMRVVAAFAQEQHETDRLRRYQEQLRGTSLKSHRAAILLWMGSDLISAAGLIVCMGFGAQAVFSGRISTGTFIAFYSYVGMLLMPVVRIASMTTYYQQAKTAFQRIMALLSEEPAIKEVARPVVFDTIRGTVDFHGVRFGYPGGKEVLSGLHFQIKPCQAAAFVGRSGAGKTTMVNLLLRFYDPCAGEVLIDGRDLKEIDLKAYRSRVAMVSQDDYLFGGTVRENIMYGKQNASIDEVVQAARLAHAHEFIEALPEGYETEIGEGGVRLSCGQRQRLSIARAFLRGPALLILDEPTSAVDSLTERMIIEDAYTHLIRGRTTVIIGHRLSTVRYADTINVLDEGKIVEQGPHDVLVRQDGFYRQLWQKQIQSEPQFPLTESRGFYP